MPNSYPRDGTFDPHFTNITDFYKTLYALYPYPVQTHFRNLLVPDIFELVLNSKQWPKLFNHFPGDPDYRPLWSFRTLVSSNASRLESRLFVSYPKVWSFCTQVLVVLYQRAGRFVTWVGHFVCKIFPPVSGDWHC